MPKEKEWAALFYMVVAPPPLVELPKDYHLFMNPKAEYVKTALSKAVLTNDMYVACRTVLDGASQNGFLEADVFGSDVATMPSDAWSFFTPAETSPDSHVYEEDLRGFYEWALPQCPARHYAVFFWGHSFGPAGLFEQQGKIVVPNVSGQGPPTWGTFDGIGTTAVPLARLASVAPLSIQDLKNVLVDCDLHVDLAVFQDCWMSTLETAYELRERVRSVIASQSLMPIGKLPDNNDPSIGVWNYDTLFQHLDSPTQLVMALYDFWNVPPQISWDNMWPNPSVPIAALHLRGLDGLTEPLKSVVDMLVNNPALAELAFVPSVYIKKQGDSPAGSDSLVDLVKLMKSIINVWPQELKPVDPAKFPPQQVEDILKLLVKSKEAYSTPDPLDFCGVSALGGPQSLGGPALHQGDIRAFVESEEDFYGQLEFSKQTGWNEIAFWNP